ncbi:MAG TPA: hypothetical protein VF584_12635 [Longimicrobium sp.]|jgi:hypothetical protein
MDEIERSKGSGSPAFKSTVVSQKGAAIRVERSELSDRMKQNLTTAVKKLGIPRSGRNS